MLLLGPPEIDPDQGIIYLDGEPHQVVTIQSLRRPPHIGHFTGEQRRGDMVHCLMDQMPENVVMAMTIVFKPQDVVAAHINRIEEASVGNQTDAMMAADEAAEVKIKMGRGDSLYPGRARRLHPRP